jgi:UPF0716 protein FxsA
MLVGFLLLICWPVAELYVAVKVAEVIGLLYTVLLLIASWPLGIWAVRSQGRAVWRRLTAAAAEGRVPAREVVDGAIVLIGGALLIIPGFITDVLGLALLAPGSRALTRRAFARNIRSRFVVSTARAARRQYDVDSTARDLDQSRLHP